MTPKELNNSKTIVAVKVAITISVLKSFKSFSFLKI